MRVTPPAYDLARANHRLNSSVAMSLQRQSDIVWYLPGTKWHMCVHNCTTCGTTWYNPSHMNQQCGTTWYRCHPCFSPLLQIVVHVV